MDARAGTFHPADCSRSASLGVRLKHSANRAVVAGQADRARRRIPSCAVPTSRKIVAHDARSPGAPGAFPHRLSAHPVPARLLRHRHARSQPYSFSPRTRPGGEMRAYLGVESLAFISIDGLYRALGEPGRNNAAPAVHRPLLHRRLPDARLPILSREAPSSSRCWPKPADRPRTSFQIKQNQLMSDDKPLDGRIALMSPAASRGIGRATAHAFPPRPARMRSRWPAPSAVLEDLDDEIKAAGCAHRDVSVPLDLTDYGTRLDRLGYFDPPALGQARHPRWQWRDPWCDLSAQPYRPQGVRGCVGGECHRELPPHPRDDPCCALRMRAAQSSFPLQPAIVPMRIGADGALEGRPRSHVPGLGRRIRNITPIKVMLVNPGGMRTKMRATAAPGEDPMTLPKPDQITPHLVAMASPTWQETGKKMFDFPQRKVLNFHSLPDIRASRCSCNGIGPAIASGSHPWSVRKWLHKSFLAGLLALFIALPAFTAPDIARAETNGYVQLRQLRQVRGGCVLLFQEPKGRNGGEWSRSGSRDYEVKDFKLSASSANRSVMVLATRQIQEVLGRWAAAKRAARAAAIPARWVNLRAEPNE